MEMVLGLDLFYLCLGLDFFLCAVRGGSGDFGTWRQFVLIIFGCFGSKFCQFWAWVARFFVFCGF